MRTGHPKKILDPLRTADDYLQVYSFIFVPLHSLYLGPIQTMVAGSCSKVEILGRTLLDLCHSTLNSGTCAISKTSVVSKTSKTITGMVAPVELETSATGHEMSNQGEYQIFPNTNLDPLGKTGGYLQLRSFTFLHNFRPS